MLTDKKYRFSNLLNTRIGFFLLVVILFCIKTYIAYQTKFTLGVKGGMQEFLLAVNPIPAALLTSGIALYFSGRLSYWLMMIIDTLESIWIFANILYYREFSDFLSLGVIKGSGNVQNNLGKSLVEILHFSDFFVFLDVIITDRSGLLTRTFDNNYIVKYLGLNEYAAFNAYQTQKESATRSKAKASDMDSILKYLDHSRAKANPAYFGKAKGENVFIIHLESFQQFLINYKVDGREVTPHLNAFFHNKNTIGFDNFFHQVAQGKTSDAEMMLENSLYGLPQGSAMVTYGAQNTYQAAPAILDQRGYTTAAFHGDVPSFWNRDSTYKSWGYDYFFSSQYYKTKPSYSVGYGLKDKIFFRDAANYIQQLPQPFYAKLITLTNHYPYLLDKQNTDFPATKTGDKTVDPYVQTAHYLDQAFAEFMNYLKRTGLMKNSMIVVYGDHYGISNNHRPAIAQLLHKKSINNYDLAQFQKVPFMIHAPGLKGGVNHTYGGEIDVLPTILHLLGDKNNNTIQFGTDLLSKQHDQRVAFRDGDFVTPKYTKVGSDVYLTKTGKLITPNAAQKRQLASIQNHVTTELSLSDRVIWGDLLRFYTPKGFKKVNRKDFTYQYTKALDNLKQAQKKEPTSIEAKNNGKSTMNLYKTDAPELK
ncbi:LTA synthase family protein [Lentilactobacillus buchneri]|nr:LTA synthase family protein [Lentilactobacillus sp. Egmn17]